MSKASRMVVAMGILLIGLPISAISQEKQSSELIRVPGKTSAKVVVDGRFLFNVRGISAVPPEQRASIVEGYIVAVAKDQTFSADDLGIVELEYQTNIVAGERLAVAIYDADAEMEGVPRQILAKAYRGKVADTIKSYRLERSRSALLSKAIRSILSVVALVVLLFLIVRLFRWLETRVEARFRSRIQGVRIQSVQLVQAEQMWIAVRGAMRMVRTLGVLVLILACLEYILTLYPWTRYLSNRIMALLLDPLRSMANSVVESVPDLLFIAILIGIVRYILKLANLFFASVGSGTVAISGFDREWALPSYKICKFLVIAFAAVVAFPYMPGSNSDAFKGISIFVGIIFSIGSTSIVSNTIAGYGLIYRRVFKVGDRVQIGDHLGDVREIRLQVTHLRTVKNEEIIVPNSVILGSNVINYSTLARSQGLILHTTVGIGYETSWRQVEAMLLIAAERTSGLLRQPAPFVRQKLLGDFCVTYEINVYCDQPQASGQLYTDLHRNILDIFNEYGVQIMTPAYEGDPEQSKVVPKDKWFEAPASLPAQDDQK